MSGIRRTLQIASLVVGVSAVSLCAVPPAAAQTSSEIAAAKQWFVEGMKLEEQGKWAEALERFQRAGAVKATPQILFHRGLCEKNTGALVEAILSFSRSASAAREAGIEHVESSANSELADVRTRVPMLNIVPPEGNKPSAVTLDGQELSNVSLNTPIPVNPGRHEIVATFASGTFRKTVQLVERQSERLVLEAPAAGAAPPPAVPPTAATSTPADASPPPAMPNEPEKDNAGPGVLPWVLIGGGVVVAAGGVLFWKKRGDQVSKLDDICPQRDACPPSRESEVESAKDDGKLYSVLGIGMLGIGAASMATGGVLLFGGDRESDAHARVLPAAGTSGAGATIVGRF